MPLTLLERAERAAWRRNKAAGCPLFPTYIPPPRTRNEPAASGLIVHPSSFNKGDTIMTFPSHCDRALRQAQEDARTCRERLAETEEAQRRDQEQRCEYEQLRRRERQAEIARSFRQADTWPEALRKQASLCRVEIDPEVDDYFVEMVAACELAGQLWTAAEAAAAPAMAELQRQIDDLHAQVQRTVAADLMEQNVGSAALEIAQLMLDPDTDLDEWLNW